MLAAFWNCWLKVGDQMFDWVLDMKHWLGLSLVLVAAVTWLLFLLTEASEVEEDDDDESIN